MPSFKPKPGSVLPRRPDNGRSEYGDNVYTEPVFLTHQIAYSITLRLAGTAADRHTIIVSRARYDRVGSWMQLSRLTLEHARQIPSGNLVGLGSLVSTLRDKAKEQTPAVPVEVYADVTRSPVAYDGLPGDPTLILITTTGLDRFLAPYRYMGRLLILSSMQVALRSNRLAIALPSSHDNSTVVTASRLEQALSNVELKTPKAESEEILLDETGPDDDLAITTGLALFFSEERLMSPEDLRFINAAQKDRNKWVV